MKATGAGRTSIGRLCGAQPNHTAKSHGQPGEPPAMSGEQEMRLRLCLGAALLSAFAALTAGPAFAQAGSRSGSICVENAGAFVIGTKFEFASKSQIIRSVDMGQYPVTVNKCTDFYDNEDAVSIRVDVVLGAGWNCRFELSKFSGKEIKLKIEGTTLRNRLFGDGVRFHTFTCDWRGYPQY